MKNGKSERVSFAFLPNFLQEKKNECLRLLKNLVGETRLTHLIR